MNLDECLYNARREWGDGPTTMKATADWANKWFPMICEAHAQDRLRRAVTLNVAKVVEEMERTIARMTMEEGPLIHMRRTEVIATLRRQIIELSGGS